MLIVEKINYNLSNKCHIQLSVVIIFILFIKFYVALTIHALFFYGKKKQIKTILWHDQLSWNLWNKIEKERKKLNTKDIRFYKHLINFKILTL